jgi:hypothetical protein
MAATEFPVFTDGVYPASIVDQEHGFSPLMDMRYSLAWRLHCDQVLTVMTGPGLQHFRTFLQRGVDGNTTHTCLHSVIVGSVLP